MRHDGILRGPPHTALERGGRRAADSPPPLARAEEQNPTRDALHSLVWRKLGHRLRSRLPLAPPRRAYHVDMDPSSDDYLGERTDGRTSPRARRPTDISTGAVTRQQASRTGKQDRGKTSTRTRKQKRVPSAVSTKTAEGRAFRTYLSNVGAELDAFDPTNPEARHSKASSSGVYSFLIELGKAKIAEQRGGNYADDACARTLEDCARM